MWIISNRKIDYGIFAETKYVYSNIDDTMFAYNYPFDTAHKNAAKEVGGRIYEDSADWKVKEGWVEKEMT